MNGCRSFTATGIPVGNGNEKTEFDEETRRALFPQNYVAQT